MSNLGQTLSWRTCHLLFFIFSYAVNIAIERQKYVVLDVLYFPDLYAFSPNTFLNHIYIYICTHMKLCVYTCVYVCAERKTAI